MILLGIIFELKALSPIHLIKQLPSSSVFNNSSEYGFAPGQ
jgi:hypothetical protein